MTVENPAGYPAIPAGIEPAPAAFITVSIPVEVEINTVWRDLWADDGQGFAYWAAAVRPLDEPDGAFIAFTYDENDESIPNPQPFMLQDAETGEWYRIESLRDMAEGWLKLRNSGLTHCGGHSIDDPDACVEDMYMQYIAFGEIVFG